MVRLATTRRRVSGSLAFEGNMRAAGLIPAQRGPETFWRPEAENSRLRPALSEFGGLRRVRALLRLARRRRFSARGREENLGAASRLPATRGTAGRGQGLSLRSPLSVLWASPLAEQPQRRFHQQHPSPAPRSQALFFFCRWQGGEGAGGDEMPLGLKPTCSVCRTTSSSMWKKGGQGEILCNNCTGRPGPPGAGGAAYATTSAAAQHSNGGGSGGGKQSKQEIHRRSARLRNTKYKSAPAAEKKVSTKGKGRRHIFKLKNPIKAPESVATIITAESIFYKGVYYQIGDVVSVIDEQDGKTYYAQIRGFIQDQYCEKSAALTWLIPTAASPKDCFDPATYIIGPEEDLPRKIEYLDFVCHAPSEYFKSRSSPFPTIPTRPEKGYIWTHVGPTPAISIKETVASSL